MVARAREPRFLQCTVQPRPGGVSWVPARVRRCRKNLLRIILSYSGSHFTYKQQKRYTILIYSEFSRKATTCESREDHTLFAAKVGIRSAHHVRESYHWHSPSLGDLNPRLSSWSLCFGFSLDRHMTVFYLALISKCQI